MNSHIRKAWSILLFAALLNPNSGYAEVVQRSFCVWDPIGTNGPYFSMMKNLQIKASAWGVALQLQAYTDEGVAANDFKTGQCDAVALTEIISRSYNAFAGTVGAVGALPTLDELHIVLNILAQPSAAGLMINGPYEVAGILPVGPIYTFVNDRSIDSFKGFQGRKMATFDVDPVQIEVARQVGASPVSSSLSRFAGQFNNGSVDIAFAPATAYMPMELYKGLRAGGGVIKRPLLQATLQVLIHREKFPADFGQNARQVFLGMLDGAFQNIESVEIDIAKEHWISVSDKATNEMDKLFRESRIKLRDKGVYDAKALRLMRKVRCKRNPSNAECVEETE
ncbi:MAG: hypothetical protein H7A01_15100 [Hahellaceae bacterium]|nr:hypothetical protein [Hahellaceae bacterium]MCP5210385.1 hypothetical protein [Hahellaceae bacterium]